MMRIALLVHDYERRGGHSRYVVELATRFAAEHEVHVFAHRFDAPLAGAVPHVVPCIRNNALASILSFAPAVELAVRRAGHFDIVHAQGFTGFRQNVMTVHMTQAGWFTAIDRLGLPQNARKRVFRAIVSRLDRWALRPGSTDAFIAVSERTRADMLRHHDTPGDRIHVLHHGVDAVTFHPDDAEQTDRHAVRVQHGLDARDVVALYVGDWQKAGAALLNALRRTQDIRLLVVTLSDRQEILTAITAAGLDDRVTVAGTTGAVARYYRAADFLVFPSFYDTFGMVVSEAMASGLPVMVSAAAGAVEWIQPGVNGLVIEDPSDAEAIASDMQRLAADLELRARLGHAARATALTHTWDAVAARTMAIYEQVLGGHEAAA